MTPEEGRALFPVLERLAYLNAGTNGPLARPTVEATHEAQERQLVEGRSGQGFVDEALALRERVRGLVADLLGCSPDGVEREEGT